MSIRWKLSQSCAYLHHLQVWPFTFNIWQVEKLQKFLKTLKTKLCSGFSTGTSLSVLKIGNNVWPKIFQLLWNVYVAKVIEHEMYLPFIVLFWWWAFTKLTAVAQHFYPVLFYQPISLEITFLQNCDSVSSICLQSMGNLLSIWRMHCSYFLVCHVFLLQWKKKKSNCAF